MDELKNAAKEKMQRKEISEKQRLQLTLYGPNSFFRRFSGHNLRYALFVYRLIGATLIEIFFDDSFLK